MEEFKGNSFNEKEKSKPEKKPLSKVVKTDIVQKKSLGRKIAETFVQDDKESIGEYLLLDILVPSVKDCVSDLVCNAINMILYGDTRGRGGSGQKTNYSGVSKSKISYRGETNERVAYSHNARAGYDFSDIVMRSRADAVNVLNALKERIDEYDVATVADFYDLVDISSVFTDNNYGWYTLDNAYINQVRGGYIIVFPKVKHLD